MLAAGPVPADLLAQETDEDLSDLVGDPVDLGLYGAPIQFIAPDGVTMELGSGRRLVDILELRPHPSGNGMVVISDIDMDEYVRGIAEMPASWPIEALKAQAVAARTYAWWVAERGTYNARGLAYDICATVACQVYRGREVVETPEVGHRWAQAVEETAGEVLLWDGAPILARYFSTSGGATRNNEDVFPSSGAFPYLVGIDDPDDAISPVHTWQAVFTREQFDDLLGRGDSLSAAVPIRDAEVIARGSGQPNQVVVTGQDGTRAQVTAGALQDFLNRVAPSVYPDDFPGPRRDGRPLPSTVPTTRYEIEVTGDQVILHGSGWGHAVGMGQYGAMGKAERGMAHDDILATYYNGVRPTVDDRAPDRIRVGLADQLDELTLHADGPFQVRVGDQTITDRGLGTWTIQAAANRTMRLVAPPGYGAPLIVDPTSTPRQHPFTVEIVDLETVVNKPAELTLEVQAAGEQVGTLELGVVDPGRHTVTWRLDTVDGPLPPGAYDVRLVAIDEEAARAGAPVEVTIGQTESSAPIATVLDDVLVTEEPPATTPVIALLLAGAAGLLGGVVLGRGRSRP
jgi:SpoIID/LytB domain protein